MAQEVADALGVVHVLTQPVEEKEKKPKPAATALQTRLAKRARLQQQAQTGAL